MGAPEGSLIPYRSLIGALKGTLIDPSKGTRIDPF